VVAVVAVAAVAATVKLTLYPLAVLWPWILMAFLAGRYWRLLRRRFGPSKANAFLCLLEHLSPMLGRECARDLS